MLGDNCSSRCSSRDHATFGACIKAKGLRIGYVESGMDATKEREWQNDIKRGESLKSQGIMPDNFSHDAMIRAEQKSEATGMAYNSYARPDLAATQEEYGL